MIEIKDIKVNDIKPFTNGFKILWTANIGFGEYTIWQETDSDIWYADSEGLDDNDNKSFLYSLMDNFIKNIIIED